MNDHTWELRVTGPDRDHADVFVRTHHFEVGAPLHFDRDYDRITALEYVLGALGADLVTGMRIRGHRRRVVIDRLEAVVRGTLNNPLAYLDVVGEQGHPGLETLSVTVYVSSADTEEDIRRVWEEVRESSPLARTLTAATNLSLRLEIVI